MRCCMVYTGGGQPGRRRGHCAVHRGAYDPVAGCADRERYSSCGILKVEGVQRLPPRRRRRGMWRRWGRRCVPYTCVHRRDLCAAINTGDDPASSDISVTGRRVGHVAGARARSGRRSSGLRPALTRAQVYFFDDNGGIDLPSSWSLQYYWNGSVSCDVPGASGIRWRPTRYDSRDVHCGEYDPVAGPCSPVTATARRPVEVKAYAA